MNKKSKEVEFATMVDDTLVIIGIVIVVTLLVFTIVSLLT